MSGKRTTLYFTPSHEITAEQRLEMERMPNARHRNASFIGPDDKVERSDFVAGPAIPAQYKNVPAPPELGEVQNDDAETDPEKMNVAELKASLKAHNVKFEAGANKAELILLHQSEIK